MSPRSYAGAEASIASSKRLAALPPDVKVDKASGEDKKILECLGAAVIMRWSTLPTKIQRELFEHATFPADLARTAPPKGQIARFLHNHKDDGDQTAASGGAVTRRAQQRLRVLGTRVRKGRKV